MPDTRIRSWKHYDAQDDELVIAEYADIGVGPAVVFDGGSFTDPKTLHAFASNLHAAADWLEREIAPKYEPVEVGVLAVGDRVEWYLFDNNDTGYEYLPCTVIETEPFTVRFTDGDEKALREGAKPPRLRRLSRNRVGGGA